jgi:hypothetical protein
MQFTTLVLTASIMTAPIQIMNLNHLAIAVALAASTSTIALGIFRRELDSDELQAANEKKIPPLFGSTAAFAPAKTSKASTALNTNFIEWTKALPFGSSTDTLGGSLPGDVGFDPIGFSTPPFACFNNPLYMREAKFAHGRMAQLMVIGFIWPGLFGTFPGSDKFGSVVAYSELNPLKAITTVPESALHQIVAGMEWFEYQRVIRIKEQGSSLLLNDISSFPNLSPSGPQSIHPSIPRCARPAGSTNAEYIRMAYVIVKVPGGSSNNHNYANVTLIVELSRLHGIHAVWARLGHVPEKPSLPNAIAPSDPPIQFAGPAGPPMRAHVKMTNGRGGMAADEKLINPHTVSFYVPFLSSLVHEAFLIAATFFLDV